MRSFFLVFLSVAVLCNISSVEGSRGSLNQVCSVTEASVSDVLSHIIPFNFQFVKPTSSSKTENNNYVSILLKAAQDTVRVFASLVLQSPIPLKSFVSHGRFMINSPKSNSKSHTKLLLVREQSLPQRALCGAAVALGTFESLACKCWDGEEIEKYWTALDYMEYSSSKFCVFHVEEMLQCATESASNPSEFCYIDVDPFRTSCINGDHDATLDYIKYELHMVTVDEMVPESVLEVMSRVVQWMPSLPVDNVLTRVIMGYIPYYPLIALIGFYIMIYEEDFSSDAMWQYTLMACLGAALSLLWLVVVLLR